MIIAFKAVPLEFSSLFNDENRDEQNIFALIAYLRVISRLPACDSEASMVKPLSSPDDDDDEAGQMFS